MTTPALPHLFTGTSTRDGRLMAIIPSVNYESRTVEVVDGVWANLIVGPVPAPLLGEVVTFVVDGVKAEQTPVWVSGGFTKNLSLTFGSTPVPPTPPVPPTGDISEAISILQALLIRRLDQLEDEARRIRMLAQALKDFAEVT